MVYCLVLKLKRSHSFLWLFVAREAHDLAVNKLEHASDLLQIAHGKHLRLCHPLVYFLHEIEFKVVHRH